MLAPAVLSMYTQKRPLQVMADSAALQLHMIADLQALVCDAQRHNKQRQTPLMCRASVMVLLAHGGYATAY